MEAKAIGQNHNEELSALRNRFEGHVKNVHDIQEINVRHGAKVRQLEDRILQVEGENIRLRTQIRELEFTLDEKTYLLRLMETGDGNNINQDTTTIAKEESSGQFDQFVTKKLQDTQEKKLAELENQQL